MNTCKRLAMLLLAAAGCGTFQYTPPKGPTRSENVVVINAPYDHVWSRAIPQIGKSFFVVNNMDRSSGFLNVSYSGDPQEYIDCGTIHAKFGRSESNFEEAQADAIYMYPAGIVGAQVSRKLSLEGRANIVFERIAASSTRVTVTARYIVTMESPMSVGATAPTTFTGALPLALGNPGASRPETIQAPSAFLTACSSARSSR